MTILKSIISERTAKQAARLLEYACYFAIAVLLLCLVLSTMGRQSFRLRTHSETFDRAIYAEENHRPHSRSFTVSMGDSILVTTGKEDQIDFATHIGLSIMYAFQSVPMILAYWFLGRVFANIRNGEIFIEQNAVYLLYYGILQLCVAAFVPFLKLFIAYLSNLFSASTIHISTGQDMLANTFPSIAFLLAAYIIHYGIHLQDEVDHTL